MRATESFEVNRKEIIILTRLALFLVEWRSFLDEASELVISILNRRPSFVEAHRDSTFLVLEWNEGTLIEPTMVLGQHRDRRHQS